MSIVQWLLIMSIMDCNEIIIFKTMLKNAQRKLNLLSPFWIFLFVILFILGLTFGNSFGIVGHCSHYVLNCVSVFLGFLSPKNFFVVGSSFSVFSLVNLRCLAAYPIIGALSSTLADSQYYCISFFDKTSALC